MTIIEKLAERKKAMRATGGPYPRRIVKSRGPTWEYVVQERDQWGWRTIGIYQTRKEATKDCSAQ